LVKISLGIGLISWLITMCGSIYIHYINIDVEQSPLSIFKPGAFEIVNLILLFGIITGFGFIVGIFSKSEQNRSLKVLALIANGVFCLSIGAILLRQAVLH